MRDPGLAYRVFEGHRYATLAGGGHRGRCFHDLRHTCASYLASQGASLLEIADVLGHRTMAMVKRYSHLARDHKAAVIERMAKARGPQDGIAHDIRGAAYSPRRQEPTRRATLS